MQSSGRIWATSMSWRWRDLLAAVRRGSGLKTVPGPSCPLSRKIEPAPGYLSGASEFNGGIQKQYIETIGTNMPVGEAFIRSFQDEGAFRKEAAHQVVGLLLNLLIGTAYAWSLQEEGSLVEKGMAYLEMLKQGFLKGGDEE